VAWENLAEDLAEEFGEYAEADNNSEFVKQLWADRVEKKRQRDRERPPRKRKTAAEKRAELEEERRAARLRTQRRAMRKQRERAAADPALAAHLADIRRRCAEGKRARRAADPEFDAAYRAERARQRREWKKKNREKYRAQQRRYHARHRDRINARTRAWKALKKGLITEETPMSNTPTPREEIALAAFRIFERLLSLLVGAEPAPAAKVVNINTAPPPLKAAPRPAPAAKRSAPEKGAGGRFTPAPATGDAEKAGRVIKVVAAHYNLSEKKLLGKSGGKAAELPRYVLWWLLAEVAGYAIAQMCEIVAHTREAVRNGLKKIEARRKAEPEFAALLQNLRAAADSE
jgi:hypothetical protein